MVQHIDFSRSWQKATKILPNDVELEEEVLGMLLLDPNAISRVTDKLTPDLFYMGAHQSICKVMLSLQRQDVPVDLGSVAIQLQEQGLLESVGGRSKLVELIDPIVHAVNVDYKVDLLVKYHKRRSMIQACQEISHLSYDISTDLEEVLELAQSKVFSLTDAAQDVGLRPLSDILCEEVSRMERIEAGQAIVGYSTGFVDLDAVTRGMKPQDLVIVAGRPSMGKTALAAHVGRNIAAQQLPVALFSLEMGGGEVARRLMSLETGIESGRLGAVRLSKQEWESIGFAVASLSGLPFYIDESQTVTPATVLAQSRKLKAARGNLGLVIIDYLHLMADGEDDTKELGKITRQCKRMARALNCPVMALSQLSRGVESRTNKRPMMSDLRQSGAIEQDADLILMLYRDEYYNPDTPDRGIAEVILTKHRNGPTGTVKLLFEPQFTRFRNLARRAEHVA